MQIHKKFHLYILIIFVFSCSNSKEKIYEDEAKPSNQVLLSSDIQWEKLNPARGDQSPQAGTIWGNRNGAVATGFLAKFVDGFSSPPHIHNVTYRALVIQGHIHNDDPSAEKMWMPAGSFWTQPAGEAHITAAKGPENIAYVEIDHGPYLVKPVEEAFDQGERPVNIDRGNLVWLDATETNIIESKGPTPTIKVAFLWTENELAGKLLSLEPGVECEISSEGDVFHGVLIQGELNYLMPGSKEIKSLDPGSYFTSKGKARHNISIKKGANSLIYIRSNENFVIIEKGNSD